MVNIMSHFALLILAAMPPMPRLDEDRQLEIISRFDDRPMILVIDASRAPALPSVSDEEKLMASIRQSFAVEAAAVKTKRAAQRRHWSDQFNTNALPKPHQRKGGSNAGYQRPLRRPR